MLPKAASSGSLATSTLRGIWCWFSSKSYVVILCLKWAGGSQMFGLKWYNVRTSLQVSSMLFLFVCFSLHYGLGYLCCLSWGTQERVCDTSCLGWCWNTLEWNRSNAVLWCCPLRAALRWGNTSESWLKGPNSMDGWASWCLSSCTYFFCEHYTCVWCVWFGKEIMPVSLVDGKKRVGLKDWKLVCAHGFVGWKGWVE